MVRIPAGTCFSEARSVSLVTPSESLQQARAAEWGTTPAKVPASKIPAMKASDYVFASHGWRVTVCARPHYASDSRTVQQRGIALRCLCLFLLMSTLTLAAPAWAQTSVTNQGGSCSTDISCTLSLAGGNGNVSFAAVVGPNCQVGQSCAFPAGSVGSNFAYQLPDGSSGSSPDFSGVMTYIGAGSCGLGCSAYYYTVAGTFSGQDSQGRAFNGSTQQALTLQGHSRGGNVAIDTGGSTTLTFGAATQSSSAQLAFLASPPSTLAQGNSLGTVMVGVEDKNGAIVTNSTATIALSLSGPSGFDPVTQTSNASQGIATFTMAAPVMIAGQYSLSPSSVGLSSPPNATIVVSTSPASPDFSLTASPTALTVAQGQSAVVGLTIIPAAGFTGTQTFSCSGLPASTNCSFNPPSLTLDGSNNPLITQMTITAGAATATAMPKPQLPTGGPEYSLFAVVLPAAFLCWDNRKLKKARRWILVGTLTLVLLMIGVSCGSSHSATQVTNSSSTAVVVTASDSSGVSRSVNIQLTVTQ